MKNVKIYQKISWKNSRGKKEKEHDGMKQRKKSFYLTLLLLSFSLFFSSS